MFDGQLDWREQKLLEAADYLEKHGWCQHVLFNSDGKVCLRGAIQAVCSEIWAKTFEVEDLLTERYFGIKRDFNRSLIPVWNNEPGRTKEEVLKVLRDSARP